MATLRTPSVSSAPRRVILTVDADADTRALYRHACESLGYAVVEACDGREALIKAFSKPPALVLLEMTLPHVNGCALSEILRRDRITRDIPILMVTADTSPATLQRAQNAGPDRILVKPVAIDRIMSELARLMAAGAGGRSNAAVTEPDGSAGGDDRPRQRTMTKSFARCTTLTPSRTPLALVCPSCDRPLTYQCSHVGGVNAREAEQWDDYSCASCGTFTYRHRTRKLTRMA